MPAGPPPPRDHWHLRRLNWLSTLTAAQAAAVRRASRVREYRPGEGSFALREPPDMSTSSNKDWFGSSACRPMVTSSRSGMFGPERSSERSR